MTLSDAVALNALVGTIPRGEPRSESGLRKRKNLDFAEVFLSLQAFDLACLLTSSATPRIHPKNQTKGGFYFCLLPKIKILGKAEDSD
jgi:hypothetical protein